MNENMMFLPPGAVMVVKSTSTWKEDLDGKTKVIDLASCSVLKSPV